MIIKKDCYVCKLEKPIDEFDLISRPNYSKKARCIACDNRVRKRLTIPLGSEKKRCKDCGMPDGYSDALLAYGSIKKFGITCSKCEKKFKRLSKWATEVSRKKCSSCLTIKPVNMFKIQPRGLLGRRSKCEICEAKRRWKYYRSNRQTLRARDRKRYWALSETERKQYIIKKSLGNASRKRIKKLRQDYNRSPIGMFFRYRSDAKRRGLSFKITFEEFVAAIKKECQYCGSIKSIGIDRINNRVGYEVKNISPCCYRCNWSKSDLTKKQWFNHIRKIAKKIGV